MIEEACRAGEEGKYAVEFYQFVTCAWRKIFGGADIVGIDQLSQNQDVMEPLIRLSREAGAWGRGMIAYFGA